MEIIFEFLFSFLGEFLLQVVIEVLCELGLRSVAEPWRAAPNPWLAGMGYAVLGAAAGGVSLWLFPALMMHTPLLRLMNLALAPVAAGVVMSALGGWRRHRGQVLLRLDRFAWGYLFALAMALVRFQFGH